MGVPIEVPPDIIGQSGLYNVPDPLLRRLRLQDTIGNDIPDLEKYFRNKEVLVLYAGSEHGLQNLKELHRNLTTFSIREMKTCSLIYISTDTSPSSPERVLAGQAWLRMAFHDNSDFAPMVPLTAGRNGADGGMEAAVEDVKRGEDFVQAGEIEIGAETVRLGVEEAPHDYVRPLSRAAVTSLMSAYSTPSLAVYHIPTHTFLAKGVRRAAFEPGKVEGNYRLWRNGGTPRVGLVEVAQAMKYPFMALVLALIYHLAITYYGDVANFIPRYLDSIGGRFREMAATKLP